ncbi:unnamed protein product [Phytomonas sp. Hart1]|nr:unnamed protein product [Phytomonas sp. Hart1]|eukprot:CCW70802.1 unnamed protein product [Phytomonas sp. isolate Hart1]
MTPQAKPAYRARNIPINTPAHNHRSVFAKIKDPSVLNDDDQILLAEVYKRRAKPLPNTNSNTNISIPILDTSRERNVGIVLKFLRLPIQTIEAVIRQFDRITLGEEHISGLVKVIPTADDFAAIERYQRKVEKPWTTTDLLKLPTPVRFFLMTKKIDHYEERIRAWMLTLELEPRVDFLMDKLQCVDIAVRAVLGSKYLPEILAYILSASNFLNAGSRYQNAQGFPITQVMNIMNFRTTDGKGILLEYVVTSISKKEPELHRFVDEILPSLDPARGVIVEDIHTELTALRTRLKSCGSLVHSITHDQRWTGILGKFICHAEPLLEKAECLASDLNAHIKLLPDFFCENTQNFSLNDVLRVLYVFCKNWETERIRQEEKEQRIMRMSHHK